MQIHKITRCKRCGDLLSAHEKLHRENGDLCAFCEHMRSEALEIYQEMHVKSHVEKNRFRLV
jgi:hypothetical protein